MKLDKSTKVYIAGCGGMLGEAVYEYFSARADVKATDIDQNTDWLGYADVRDYWGMYEDITAYGPDLIINLAALTDLEYCEQNADNAWATNALGAENLALIAGKLDVPNVYICTAGIVDGEQDVYNDFDAPNPLSIYAKSKYHGECFVKSHLKKHFIFRAGWMMGGGPAKDKKFVNKIYQQLQGGATELFVVDDKLGTPTYTVSFAEGIYKVVESDLYGLYNQVCGGDSSRYDVAVEFVRLLGLEDKITVTKVSSDHFKAEYFAPRPPSEKLVNFKLDARKINYMPHWKDALELYAERFK
ncbi:MAG: NAD(P)-dependent oxidoreductase [Pseudomonadota bacterium]